MSKKMFCVTTVVHETTYVEANTAEEACEEVCNREKADSYVVHDRFATESVSLDPIVRKD